MSEAFFDVSAHAYAHRGLWDSALPENSLAAFRAAASAHLGVELDVRLTSDEVPVVFHDASLLRICTHGERLDRIAAADLSRWPLPDGSTIPTLASVLDIMGDLPVLIELKVDGASGDLADRVAETIAGRTGRLAVMSFDEHTVARLCHLITDRPVGLLVSADSQVEADIVAKAATARALGCDYIGPNISIVGAIAGASGGLPLVTWTVRTEGELAHARKHGAAPVFEGPIFDGMRPALAMSPGTPI